MLYLTLRTHGMAPVKINRRKVDHMNILSGDVVKIAFEYHLPHNDRLHVVLMDAVILSAIGNHLFEASVIEPAPLPLDLSSIVVPQHSVADICCAAA